MLGFLTRKALTERRWHAHNHAFAGEDFREVDFGAGGVFVELDGRNGVTDLDHLGGRDVEWTNAGGDCG